MSAVETRFWAYIWRSLGIADHWSPIAPTVIDRCVVPPVVLTLLPVHAYSLSAVSPGRFYWARLSSMVGSLSVGSVAEPLFSSLPVLCVLSVLCVVSISSFGAFCRFSDLSIVFYSVIQWIQWRASHLSIMAYKRWTNVLVVVNETDV